MTDFDKLKTLLDDFGVGYTEFERNEYFEYDGIGKRYDVIGIRCTEGDKKVEGYIGFYTEYFFHETGEFINMGAFE